MALACAIYQAKALKTFAVVSSSRGSAARATRIAKRFSELALESQDQKLALTVLYVPYFLDSGQC